MDKNKYADFEDRFIFDGARFITNENQSCFSNYGFRIVIGQREVYMSCGAAHATKYKNFMLKVTGISAPDGYKELLEQDIVDYRLISANKDERSVGVLCYDKERFLYAIKDTYTLKLYPLFECKVFDVLGNIYENPEFLSLRLKTIYQRLKKEYIEEKEDASIIQENNKEKEYAYIDEPIPGITKKKEVPKISATGEKDKKGVVDIYVGVSADNDNVLPSWEYMLTAPSGKSKSAKGMFSKKGNFVYYEIAALAIATSNIHSAQKIRIHAGNDVIPKLLGENRLNKMAQNNWKKKDGSPLNNIAALAALKKELDRLSCSIEVLLLEKRVAS